MADGKVTIEILGDASKFKEAVSSLGSTTASALSSASSAVSKVGTAVTAAVTTPLVAATAKVTQWALTTASSAEQADIAFSTMLGPERAKQMISELTEFAKTTPFEMNGLTDATQKLLAYGFAADDIIPTLTAVGDATAALGTGQEGIDAVTRALGQMQAKGKVMSEEMLQLTEQGIPAWKYLAEALGTDVAGAQAQVTAGSVDAATAIEALKNGMEGDFGGLMTEQSKTLSGALSNLSDSAEATVKELYKTDAYQALAQAVSDLSTPVGNLVSNLMPSLEGVVSTCASVVGGLASSLGSLDGSQVSSIADALGLLAGTGPALLVTGNALGVAGKAINAVTALETPLASVASVAKDKLGDAFTSAGSALGTAKDAFSSAGSYIKLMVTDSDAAADKFFDAWDKAAAVDPVTGIKSGLTSLGSVVSSAAGPIASFTGTVVSGFASSTVVVGALAAALGVATLAGSALGVDMDAAFSSMASSIGNVAPLVTSVFEQLEAAAPQAIEALTANGEAIAESVSTLITSVVEGFSQLSPQLIELVGSAAQVIAETLVAAAPTLLEGAMQLFATILQALAETATQIAPYVPQLIQGLAESFAANAPTLLAAAGDLFLAIAQALPQVLPSVLAALPTVINGVTSALPGFLGQVLSAAVNLFIGIANALPQVLPSVISALGSLIGSVVSNIPSYVGQILAAALTLFLAIAQAVPETAGNLLSAVGSLLEQARSAIASFSLADVGYQLIQGLIGGIQSAIGGLVSAAASAAQSALNAAKSALGIASPSKVFRREVGRWIPLGAALGVEDEAGEWRKSVDRTFDYTPAVSWSSLGASSLSLPDQPSVSGAYQAVADAETAAREAQEAKGSIVEEMGQSISELGDRLERALGEPTTLTVNKREAGKIVRGLVTA